METVAIGKNVRSVLQHPAQVFDELLTEHPDTTPRNQDVQDPLNSPRSVFEKLNGPLTEIPTNKQRRKSFNPKNLLRALRSGEQALKIGESALNTWTVCPQMVQVRPAQKRSGTADKCRKLSSPAATTAHHSDVFSLASALASPALAPFTVAQLFQIDLFGLGQLDDLTSIESENLDPNLMLLNAPEQQDASSTILSKRMRAATDETRVDRGDVFQDFDVGIWWKIKADKFIVCNFAMDSEAPKMGVQVGDILRSVDGMDILGFKVDEEGHHIADDLLIGKEGSVCNLKFLRVAKRTLDQPRRTGTPLVEFSCSIRRGSVVDDNIASAATGVVLNLQ